MKTQHLFIIIILFVKMATANAENNPVLRKNEIKLGFIQILCSEAQLYYEHYYGKQSSSLMLGLRKKEIPDELTTGFRIQYGHRFYFKELQPIETINQMVNPFFNLDGFYKQVHKTKYNSQNEIFKSIGLNACIGFKYYASDRIFADLYGGAQIIETDSKKDAQILDTIFSRYYPGFSGVRFYANVLVGFNF